MIKGAETERLRAFRFSHSQSPRVSANESGPTGTIAALANGCYHLDREVNDAVVLVGQPKDTVLHILHSTPKDTCGPTRNVDLASSKAFQ